MSFAGFNRILSSIWECFNYPIKLDVQYARIDTEPMSFAKAIGRYDTYTYSDGKCNFEHVIESLQDDELRKIVQQIDRDQNDLVASYLSYICIYKKGYINIPAFVLANENVEEGVKSWKGNYPTRKYYSGLWEEIVEDSIPLRYLYPEFNPKIYTGKCYLR